MTQKAQVTLGLLINIFVASLIGLTFVLIINNVIATLTLSPVLSTLANLVVLFSVLIVIAIVVSPVVETFKQT